MGDEPEGLISMKNGSICLPDLLAASEKKSMWELSRVRWLVKVTGVDGLGLRLTTGQAPVVVEECPQFTPSALEILISDDNDGIFFTVKDQFNLRHGETGVRRKIFCRNVFAGTYRLNFSVTDSWNYSAYLFQAQNYKTIIKMTNIILNRYQTGRVNNKWFIC